MKTSKRWLIIYMPSRIKHVRGTENIADPMSRNPAVNADWDKFDDEEKGIFDEKYINGVSIDEPRTRWHPDVRIKVYEHKEDYNS
jgi:hypothetical protein